MVVPSSPITVLLVEDDDVQARLLAHELHGTVRRVERVSSAAAARDFLAAGAPRADAILLDLELGDARGIDALDELRAAAEGIPIVVLTGRDDDELALAALRAGAQDYLVKGRVDSETVVRALRYAIERGRIERELAEARWLAGVGEIALAIRHEINNPLAILVAYAELIPHCEGIDDTRDAARTMHDAAMRISAVVRRLDTLDRARSVEYLGGKWMVDLGGA